MVESLSPAAARFRLFRRHEFNLLLAIVAVVVVTLLLDTQHNYARDPWRSLVDVTRQTSLLGIFSLGAAIVIIAGGIDLSSGSVICFSGTICATLLLWLAPEAMQSRGTVPLGTGAIVLAIVGTLFIGFLIGSLHAWLITIVGLPPFVATLATLVGLRSFARAICENVTAAVGGGANTQIYVFDTSFRYLATSVWIPALIFVALAALCWLLLGRTVLGRHLYALGGNEQAARLSGIRTDRLKWFAYCVSAVVSAIAGILQVADVSVAEPHTLGLGSELNAIAAAVIGGCSLQGGVGTIPGTVLGALFLRTVMDGVAKIIKTGADVYEGLIVGTVVVLAVAFSQVEQSRRRGGFFTGGLGIIAALNLSIFAAVIAAMIGPQVYLSILSAIKWGFDAIVGTESPPVQTSLDGTFLAWLAFTAMWVVVVLIRSNLNKLTKRLLGLMLLIVILVVASGVDSALPRYRLHSATSMVASLGGSLETIDEGRRVNLAGSQVDDAALKRLIARLRFVPDVVEMTLAGTSVTDEGVSALERLTTLKRLDVTNTRVTRTGTARLTRTNRELEITPSNLPDSSSGK